MTSGRKVTNRARIIKCGSEFRPADAVRTNLVGKLGSGSHQVADARVAGPDVCDEGRGVRRQQASHVRIQGVVGEETLRADRQQGNLDIEQGTVETGDAVPLTGGPPAPQPMTDGQATQRGYRCRRDVDSGDLDAAWSVGGFRHRRSKGDVSGLTENAPQPVGARQVGEGDLGCVGWLVDRQDSTAR